MYRAIVHIDYKTKMEQMKGDFGPKEYARYKKRADKAEIFERWYSPFPSIIAPEPEKVAILYFDTEGKFEVFKKYAEEQEEKYGEFFGRFYEYNVEESKLKNRD